MSRLYLVVCGLWLILPSVMSVCTDPETVINAVMNVSDNTVSYTCQAGFKIQDEPSFTLVATQTCTFGSWNGSKPVCTDIQCPPISNAPQNAQKMDGGLGYQDEITYTCNDGYRTPTGARTTTLVCQADETWSKDPPTCNRISCPEPENIGHATRNTQAFVYEDVVTYVCDLGYESTYGDLNLMCDAHGSWNGTWPSCTKKVCGDPGSIDNAVRLLSGIKYLETVNYTCLESYEHDVTMGPLTRTCQANGAWSGLDPACIGILCGQPPEPANSTHSPVDAAYRYPDSVIYTCNAGFRPDYTDGGIKEVTCQKDGTWDFPVMGCTKKHCVTTNVSVNAIESPGTTYYDQTKTYTCKPGYMLSSGDLTRYCQADGTFTGSVPVCERLSCRMLVDPPLTTREGSSRQYLDSVTYTCNHGYQIQGEISSFKRVLFCQGDGMWSDTEPTCEPLDCGTPSTGSNVIIVSQSGTGYGASITVKCADGYELTSGDLTRSCQANKTWSGAVAVCSPVSCGNPPMKAHVKRYGDTFTYTSRVFYMCSPGYKEIPGDQINQYSCLLNKSWGGERAGIPNCAPVECHSPEKIKGATLLNDSEATYTYGQKIIYECNFGHYHNNASGGPLERQCMANKAWSGQRPVCSRKSCDDPGDREGSYKLGFSFLYLDQVNYTCKAGFEANFGKSWSAVTCQENGTWTGQFPDCKRVVCRDPGVGEHSTRIVHGLEFEATIDYKCDEGYRVESGVYKLMCTEERTWTYPMPICTNVENINATEKVNSTALPPVESETSNLIGKICIVCISIEIGIVVILDMTTIWKDVRIGLRNLKHGLRRMKKVRSRHVAEDKVSPLRPADE